jgi:hypothetical protein
VKEQFIYYEILTYTGSIDGRTREIALSTTKERFYYGTAEAKKHEKMQEKRVDY